MLTGTVHDWPIYFIARFIKSASLSVFIEKLDGLGPVDYRPYPNSVFIITNKRMNYSMNELINYEGVYRTAPAAPVC